MIDFLDSLSNRRDYHLNVRVHPNLAYKSSREIERWVSFAEKYSSANVTFIMHDSEIKTYDLLQNSDFVITYGSTIGVEAAYFEVPSILVSSAFHLDLDIAKHCSSIEDVWDSMENFFTKDELSMRKTRSLSYGFFYASGGTRVANLELAGNPSVQDPPFKFKNVKFQSNKLVTMIRLVEGSILRSRKRLFNRRCVRNEC